MTNYSRAQIQKHSRNSCFAGLSSQQFSDYANRQNHVSGCGNNAVELRPSRAHDKCHDSILALGPWFDQLRLQKHQIDLGFICQFIQISFSLPDALPLSSAINPPARRPPRCLPITEHPGGERTSATPPLINSSQVMESESKRRTSCQRVSEKLNVQNIAVGNEESLSKVFLNWVLRAF